MVAHGCRRQAALGVDRHTEEQTRRRDGAVVPPAELPQARDPRGEIALDVCGAHALPGVRTADRIDRRARPKPSLAPRAATRRQGCVHHGCQRRLEPRARRWAFLTDAHVAGGAIRRAMPGLGVPALGALGLVGIDGRAGPCPRHHDPRGDGLDLPQGRLVRPNREHRPIRQAGVVPAVVQITATKEEPPFLERERLCVLGQSRAPREFSVDFRRREHSRTLKEKSRG
jgi:hypothetical protein